MTYMMLEPYTMTLFVDIQANRVLGIRK